MAPIRSLSPCLPSLPRGSADVQQPVLANLAAGRAVLIRDCACALALLAIFSVASPAAADCEGGIAALKAQTAEVADPHLRSLLLADLRRAQFELWEFDEVECRRGVSTTPCGC